MNYAHLFTKHNKMKEILRVDHAGELGAKNIYMGQLKALKGDREIIEMLEAELKHLEFFEEELKKHKFRPSILNPIWGKCAFLMGYLSAKVGGRRMAMLCTQKVEEVIEKHYAEQISILEDSEFKKTLTKFREEELEHMHIGYKESEGLKTAAQFFTFATKLGIFFSKKI